MAPAASAQAYPPGNCNVTIGNQNLGSLNFGDSQVVIAPSCVFQVNAPVTITINNTQIGDTFADPSGLVAVPISILPSKTFLIHGRQIPAVCGLNVLRGVGFSAVASTNVTQTVTFNVSCPSVEQAKPGAVAFTGGNIIRWSMMALATMLVGALLVTFARRRPSRRDGSDEEKVSELTRS
ncbi:MAG: hypothetical protein LC733_00160 [Actinobacteria bacterium]|nr:hypothetical protein [Actinomycetota bacterium]